MTKFKGLAYSKDDDMFLFWAESTIQASAEAFIGRELDPKELKYLKKKVITATHNLIIKIGSSGIGNEKES